jgi:hypothetical protein
MRSMIVYWPPWKYGRPIVGMAVSNCEPSSTPPGARHDSIVFGAQAIEGRYAVNCGVAGATWAGSSRSQLIRSTFMGCMAQRGYVLAKWLSTTPVRCCGVAECSQVVHGAGQCQCSQWHSDRPGIPLKLKWEAEQQLVRISLGMSRFSGDS